MPAPAVLAALISGGSQLVGSAIGGIGAAGEARGRRIGQAQHAAKLDDIGQRLMDFEASPELRRFAGRLTRRAGRQVEAPDIGAIDPLMAREVGGYDDLPGLAFGNQVQAMQTLAGNVQDTDSRGLRARINRELAASGRSADAQLGATGALGSGVRRDVVGNMQGGALAQLAEAMNQDELQRAQLGGQLLGQSGQLGLGQQQLGFQRGQANRQFQFNVDTSNRDAQLQTGQFNRQMDFNRQLNNAQFGLEAERLTQGSEAQALQALMGIDQMRQQSQIAGSQVYQNPAFASPRYNHQTGEVRRGK